MTLATIAEAIAKLPPDQLARFRRWFAAFEAGRSDHAKELDSTAIKLGRLASRALAELKKRAKGPLSVPRTTAPMRAATIPQSFEARCTKFSCSRASHGLRAVCRMCRISIASLRSR
jgi:hypothetical protein